MHSRQPRPHELKEGHRTADQDILELKVTNSEAKPTLSAGPNVLGELEVVNRLGDRWYRAYTPIRGTQTM